MVRINNKKDLSQETRKKRKKVGNKLVTLRGVVIPVDWDRQGKIVATAISTHNEEEFLIKEDENSKNMIALINEEVEITGWCRKIKGKKMVIINTCKRISGESNKPLESNLL